MTLKRMFVKKGSAALVVVVLVLGYMMSVSMSNITLITTETTGQGAREGYKKAHYAAMAGIGIVMARLRQEPAKTFSSDYRDRPYFTLDPSLEGYNEHHVQWGASLKYRVPVDDHLYAPGWISVDSSASAFASDTLILDDYSVRICSYFYYDNSVTGQPPVDYYYVKSQGRYIDFETDREHLAQIWARFIVRGPARLISLDSYGSMDVQPLLPITGSVVNDFWDWQNQF